MKEKLYTIEVMDALKAADECPCCNLERKMEQGYHQLCFRSVLHGG